RIRVRMHTENGAVTEETWSDPVFGTEEFVLIHVTHTRVSDQVTHATVTIEVTDTDGTEVQIDHVQLQASPYLQPYRDGDHPDGVWYATPHASMSGVVLSPNTQYVFSHIFRDEDGIYDAPLNREIEQADTYVT